MEVSEPYERWACNALRRECYRRRLRVVKSGALANATKSGFVALLRADDAETRKAAEGKGNERFKRRKTTDEQSAAPHAVSQGSLASTQRSLCSVLEEEEEEEATRSTWVVPVGEVESEANTVGVTPGEARWERLYARLELVTHKLRELRVRGDDRDVAFYETLKKQLQQQLLDCVTQV